MKAALDGAKGDFESDRDLLEVEAVDEAEADDLLLALGEISAVRDRFLRDLF